MSKKKKGAFFVLSGRWGTSSKPVSLLCLGPLVSVHIFMTSLREGRKKKKNGQYYYLLYTFFVLFSLSFRSGGEKPSYKPTSKSAPSGTGADLEAAKRRNDAISPGFRQPGFRREWPMHSCKERARNADLERETSA